MVIHSTRRRNWKSKGYRTHVNMTKPVPRRGTWFQVRSSTVVYLDERPRGLQSADPTAGPPGNSIWRRRECKHALAPFRLGTPSVGALARAFSLFPGQVQVGRWKVEGGKDEQANQRSFEEWVRRNGWCMVSGTSKISREVRVVWEGGSVGVTRVVAQQSGVRSQKSG